MRGLWKPSLFLLFVLCVFASVEAFVEMPLDGWVYDAAVESVPMVRPVIAKFDGGKMAEDGDARKITVGRFTRYHDESFGSTLASSFEVSPEREALQLLSS